MCLIRISLFLLTLLVITSDSHEQATGSSVDVGALGTVKYQDNGDNTIDFTISGKTGSNGYVAIGISDDKIMGDDTVLACVQFNSQRYAQLMHNSPYKFASPITNVPADLKLTLVSHSYTSGVLECQIRRSVNGSNTQIYDLTNQYYVLFAKGVAPSATAISNHSPAGRISSTDKVNFQTGKVEQPIGSVKFGELGTVKFQGNGNGKIDFTVSGKLDNANGYVAVGISEDDRMGKTTVLACIQYGGQRSAHLMYNPGGTTAPVSIANVPAEQQLNLVSHDYTNGVLTCQIQRPVTSSTPQIYDLTKEYYILFAKGDAPSADSVTYHTNRQASPGKANFQTGKVEIGVKITMSDDNYVCAYLHGLPKVL